MPNCYGSVFNLSFTSNLTANRALNIVTGDAARTLTLSGDATISGTNTGDQYGSTTASRLHGRGRGAGNNNRQRPLHDRHDSERIGWGGGVNNKEQVLSVGSCTTGGAVAATPAGWLTDSSTSATLNCRGNTFQYASLSFSELSTAYIPATVPSDWTSGAVALTLYGTNGGRSPTSRSTFRPSASPTGKGSTRPVPSTTPRPRRSTRRPRGSRSASVKRI